MHIIWQFDSNYILVYKKIYTLYIYILAHHISIYNVHTISLKAGVEMLGGLAWLGDLKTGVLSGIITSSAICLWLKASDSSSS